MIPNWLIVIKNRRLRKKKLNKNNSDTSIQGFIFSIVGVAVVLAVGLIVLSQLKESMGQDSVGPITGLTYNATGPLGTSVNTMLSTLPQWIGVLITVTLAFIVLGYFYKR